MQNRKSFTLVELLLIIVIIAILAGTLYSVIDPVSKIQRSKDGVIEADMSKIVLAINSYYNSVGVYPGCQDLAVNGELLNAQVISSCGATGGNFTISGVSFPDAKCDGNGYPSGNATCSYHYGRNADGSAACIGATLWQEGGGTGPANNNYLLWTSGTMTGGAITRGVFNSTTFTCSL